jgi:hypothetical protein
MIGRLVKLVLVLGVVLVAGLAVFAYVGDLSPAPSPQSLSVTLNAN